MNKLFRSPSAAHVPKHDVVLRIQDDANPAIEPFFVTIASRDGNAIEHDLARQLAEFLRPGVSVKTEVVPSRFGPRQHG